MKIPALLKNEAERQGALEATDLLNRGSDVRFDRITHLVRQCFSVPVVWVSLIDGDRQWFKSRQGLVLTETSRHISFCGHTILQASPLVITNTLEDPRFVDNPLVTGAPHIRFYAGVPLHTRAGYPIGTLCLIDTQPRVLTADQTEMLSDFAATIEALIHADEATLNSDFSVANKLQKHQNALALLNNIAFSRQPSLNEKIDHALSAARQYLRMDTATLSQAEGQAYTIDWKNTSEGVALETGHTLSLTSTLCQHLLGGEASEEKTLFITNIEQSRFFNASYCPIHQSGTYAGTAIEIDNQVVGTLSFTAHAARSENYDESEQLFIRLLARWFSDVLTNSRHNERLSKLTAQLPGVTYQFKRFPDGRLTFPFSSPQIQALYGLSPEQAAIDATPAFARIHPDDVADVSVSIERSANTLEYWQATFRVQSDEEEYRWIMGQATPERLMDGSILWHGYLYDIHEKEQARLALERNEARLRGLFEFSPIGIALNDVETGQFIDVNDALIQPTGYSREEFLALSYWDVTPQTYQPQEEQALLGLATTGRYAPFEKEYIRKDGSRYPVRLQGMLSQERDGRNVIWSLVEDITERRKLDKMKDQFIATVSHELRTPLTSIKGALGLLKGGATGQLPDKAQSLVITADRNAQRLASLINDLLDMEKLVAGKMPIDLTPQLLSPLLDEAVESMQGYCEQYQIAIETTPMWPSVWCEVDAARLIQALTNLLSNAVKFSPPGSAVELAIILDENAIEISVRDHGPGVTAAFRDQLFQRFVQADGSDTRKLGGTGLGLAISQEICHQMGGEIGYRDAKGGGANFFIVLPRKYS